MLTAAQALRLMKSEEKKRDVVKKRVALAESRAAKARIREALKKSLSTRLKSVAYDIAVAAKSGNNFVFETFDVTPEGAALRDAVLSRLLKLDYKVTCVYVDETPGDRFDQHVPATYQVRICWS